MKIAGIVEDKQKVVSIEHGQRRVGREQLQTIRKSPPKVTSVKVFVLSPFLHHSPLPSGLFLPFHLYHLVALNLDLGKLVETGFHHVLPLSLNKSLNVDRVRLYVLWTKPVPSTCFSRPLLGRPFVVRIQFEKMS